MDSRDHTIPADGGENAERELREFSYIVSHDLATELRHLCEFSRLLVEELKPDERASYQQYSDILLATGKKTRAMLDALLRYSRVQQAPLSAHICDGSQLVARALQKVKDDISACGARIDCTVNGRFSGDETQLTDAIRLVIENALKFRAPGKPPHIELTGGSTDVWTLTLADDGIGLEERYWEKAFQMFWRLEPNRHDGVGAGLAVCRRIIRRNGGDIRFIAADCGARVEITLPVPPQRRVNEDHHEVE